MLSINRTIVAGLNLVTVRMALGALVLLGLSGCASTGKARAGDADGAGKRGGAKEIASTFVRTNTSFDPFLQNCSEIYTNYTNSKAVANAIFGQGSAAGDAGQAIANLTLSTAKAVELIPQAQEAISRAPQELKGLKALRIPSVIVGMKQAIDQLNEVISGSKSLIARLKSGGAGGATAANSDDSEETGAYSDAAADGDESVGVQGEDLTPEEVKSRIVSADSLMEKGDPKAAGEEYLKILYAIPPSHRRAVYLMERRGTTLVRQQEWRKARRFYRCAILTAEKQNVRGNDLFNAYNSLALAYEKEGRVESALANYKKAARLTKDANKKRRINRNINKLTSKR